MKVEAKIWFTDDKGNKFFGKGPYDLLLQVDRTGSLNQAAKNLYMSYSKAFNVMKHSERVYGKKLLHSEIGGAHGGGSTLTDEARKLIKHYEQAREEVNDKLNELSEELTDAL